MTGSISHKNSTKAAGSCFTLIQTPERLKDLFRLGCAGWVLGIYTGATCVSTACVEQPDCSYSLCTHTRAGVRRGGGSAAWTLICTSFLSSGGVWLRKARTSWRALAVPWRARPAFFWARGRVGLLDMAKLRRHHVRATCLVREQDWKGVEKNGGL